MRKFYIYLFTLASGLVFHSFGYASDRDVAVGESRLVDDDNSGAEVKTNSVQNKLKLFSTDGSATSADVEEYSKETHEKEVENKAKEKVKPERSKTESSLKVEDGFLHFNAIVMIGDELIDTWFNGQRCCDALKPLNLSVAAGHAGGVEVKIDGHKMTMFPGDRVAIPRSQYSTANLQKE